MAQSNKGSRHKARRLLVQALYQLQLTDHDSGDIADQFAEHPEAESAELGYFSRVLAIVTSQREQLDDDITTAGREEGGGVAAQRTPPPPRIMCEFSTFKFPT